MRTGERPGQEKHAAFKAGLPGLPIDNGESRGNDDLTWYRRARTYRIHSVSGNLGIPERSWNNPTVYSFVETTQNAEDLNTTLSVLHGKNQHIEVTPSLSSRYNRLDVLMNGLNEILTTGLEGHPFKVEYAARRVEGAVAQYGVVVTSLSHSEEAPPITEIEIPTPQQGSAWRDFEQPEKVRRGAAIYELYNAMYGSQNYKLWGSWPGKMRDEQQEQERVIQTAQRLGIPDQNVELQPVKEFITTLLDAEDLLTTFEQGEIPPGAPGLTPTITERYTMAAHLMRVGIAIMEEGFQGRTVDPQFIAEHVNSALSYFGLQARLQLEGEQGLPRYTTIVDAEY